MAASDAIVHMEQPASDNTADSSSRTAAVAAATAAAAATAEHSNDSLFRSVHGRNYGSHAGAGDNVRKRAARVRFQSPDGAGRSTSLMDDLQGSSRSAGAAVSPAGLGSTAYDVGAKYAVGPLLGTFKNADVEMAYKSLQWHHFRYTRPLGITWLVLVLIVQLRINKPTVSNTTTLITSLAAGLVCTLAILPLLGSCLPRWRRSCIKWWSVCIAPLACVSMAIVTLVPVMGGCPEPGSKPDPDGLLVCSALLQNEVQWYTATTIFTLIIIPPLLAGALWAVVLPLIPVYIFYLIGIARYLESGTFGFVAFNLSMAIACAMFGTKMSDRFQREAFLHTQKAAEALLRMQEAAELQEEAEAANKDYENVIRYVCHEVRNPLHGMMGLLETMTTHTDVFVQQITGTCLRTGKHMATILDDVLDLGQLQRGVMKLTDEKVDLVQLVLQCVTNNMGLAEVPAGVHVATGMLPKCMGVTDPLRVAQIINNAMSNAFKATHTGQVDVYLFTWRRWFCIEVADSGKGLTKQQAAKLFQPYQQVAGATTPTKRAHRSRFVKGTGLGLAITAHIVKLLHGRVGLAPRDTAAGARFWVCLPWHESSRSGSTTTPRFMSQSSATSTVSDTVLPSDERFELQPADTLNIEFRCIQTLKPNMSSRDLMDATASAASLEHSRNGVQTPAQAAMAAEAAAAGAPGAPAATGRVVALEAAAGAEAGSNRSMDEDMELVAGAAAGVASDADSIASGDVSSNAAAGKAHAKQKTGRRRARPRPRGGRGPAAAAAAAGAAGGGGGGGTAAVSQVPQASRVAAALRAHALVVDDDAVSRFVLRRHLEQMRCSSSMLEDGTNVVDMLDNQPDGATTFMDPCTGLTIDIIFMDFNMGNSYGPDICRQLRARGVATPMVAVTGDSARQEALAAGFNDILQKPFSSGDVQAMLQKFSNAYNDVPGFIPPPVHSLSGVAAGAGAGAGAGVGLPAQQTTFTSDSTAASSSASLAK